MVAQKRDAVFKAMKSDAGGEVASWTDRAVRVQALAEDIVLCSWARHLSLTAGIDEFNVGGIPATD